MKIEGLSKFDQFIVNHAKPILLVQCVISCFVITQYIKDDLIAMVALCLSISFMALGSYYLGYLLGSMDRKVVIDETEDARAKVIAIKDFIEVNFQKIPQTYFKDLPLNMIDGASPGDQVKGFAFQVGKDMHPMLHDMKFSNWDVCLMVILNGENFVISSLTEKYDEEVGDVPLIGMDGVELMRIPVLSLKSQKIIGFKTLED